MSQLNSGGPRELALNLLSAANRADDPGKWLASVLPGIATDLAAAYVAVVIADGGRWNALAETGPPRSLPLELLAEALDREAARSQGSWVAGPLSSRAVSSQALLACWPSTPPPDAMAAVKSLLPVFGEALASVPRARPAIAANPSPGDAAANCQPMEPDAGDRTAAGPDGGGRHALAEGDRASIFLWDRAHHCLVGRPALGLKGGELRVADDRGVVGRVLQSGEPARVVYAPPNPRPSIITSTSKPAIAPARSSALLCKLGRARLRRFRIDQQTLRASPRKTKRPSSNWPPTPRWPWRTSRTARS